MENITIRDLIDGLAALIVVFNFGKWLISFGNPIVELKKAVAELQQKTNKDESRLDNIDNAIKQIDNGITVLGKALNELLRHEITGNDIGALKNQQENVNEYFYRK